MEGTLQAERGSENGGGPMVVETGDQMLSGAVIKT
jgi:hypothetical protein